MPAPANEPPSDSPCRCSDLIPLRFALCPDCADLLTTDDLLDVVLGSGATVRIPHAITTHGTAVVIGDKRGVVSTGEGSSLVHALRAAIANA